MLSTIDMNLIKIPTYNYYCDHHKITIVETEYVQIFTYVSVTGGIIVYSNIYFTTETIVDLVHTNCPMLCKLAEQVYSLRNKCLNLVTAEGYTSLVQRPPCTPSFCRLQYENSNTRSNPPPPPPPAVTPRFLHCK